MDIFFCGGGSSQNWTIFRDHFYAFLGLFLRSRYRIGDIFLVAKISNIFLACLKFLLIFWGLTVDAGPEPTYAEKIRVPPLGSPDPLSPSGSAHRATLSITNMFLKGYPLEAKN